MRNFTSTILYALNQFQFQALSEISTKENATIDVNAIKSRFEKKPERRSTERTIILKELLLKEFPPKRINGLINLMYATRSTAEPNEIQSALVNKILN